MAHTRPEPDTGIADEVPDRAHSEAARALASQARLFLSSLDEGQVLQWADTYIARMGSGDVRSFVEWIHLRRRRRAS